MRRRSTRCARPFGASPSPSRCRSAPPRASAGTSISSTMSHGPSTTAGAQRRPRSPTRCGRMLSVRTRRWSTPPRKPTTRFSRSISKAPSSPTKKFALRCTSPRRRARSSPSCARRRPRSRARRWCSMRSCAFFRHRASACATPPTAMYTAAIVAKSKGDEDKIMSALARLAEEDIGFSSARDPVTNEVLVHGLGDVHLDVALERMKRKYGVDAVLHPPRIPYRETITGTARVAHKYKKQSGGAGLYGDATIEVEPLPRGGGYEWQDKIFGGAIPQQFRPSVEKGVRQTIEQGAISGNPVVDVKVRLVDGSTHSVDGKDIAFQIAGSMAMREAVQKANPVLLEPVMDVRVTVPERNTGDVMGLLNSKRGRVGGMNPLGDGRAEVTAQLPQAEMYTFPIELRAMTQGRGRYAMAFSHYEEVPAHIAQKVIEAHTKEHAPAAV